MNFGVKHLLVLAVLAPMPWLIRYSNEVKPYIVDIFAAALLLWLTARVLSGHRERWSLPLALFLLPLASLPAIFCGAGVLCALVVHHGRGALRERTVWTAAAAWLLGSGLTFLFTKNPSQTAWSLHYWEGSFAFRGLADGYVQRFLAFYAELAFVPPPGLRDVRAPWLIPGAVVLVGAGVVHLWRRGQRASRCSCPCWPASRPRRPIGSRWRLGCGCGSCRRTRCCWPPGSSCCSRAARGG